MHKNITIIGSTGSLGTQALDIIRREPELRAVALAVKDNIDSLREQIDEFRPDIVCVYDSKKAAQLRPFVKCRVVSGMEGLIEAASYEESDLLLTAVTGMVGIRPTIAALEAGKDVALANKESLVCAGDIIMNLAKAKGAHILPVDSEHSAIFQSHDGNNAIKKILLTCSGGPFRGYTKQQLEQITLEQALAHPVWHMGQKITIDCATLINKGLEVIEASHLFSVPVRDIQVVVHPQSIIHSMTEYDDNAILAQLGTQDMRIPIAYAFFYPERRDIGGRELDFWQIPDLHFEKPDTEVFEGLALAYQAAESGGSMPAVFNAANEFAVRSFLNRQIRFCEITDIIKNAMQQHKLIPSPTLDEILHITEEFHC